MISLNPFRKKTPWTPDKLRVAVLRVMEDQAPEKDPIANWLAKEIRKEGHILVVSGRLPKDYLAIGAAVTDAIRKSLADMVFVSGGTGLSRTDITIEACKSLFHRELPSFEAIFSSLLFQERGSAALLSRASAGAIEESLVFCIPDDLKACRLACYDLIFTEARRMIGSIRQPVMPVHQERKKW